MDGAGLEDSRGEYRVLVGKPEEKETTCKN
jgi:hypothetical protein